MAPGMTSSSERAIRLARAAFNQALVAGDLAAIGAILAPDAVLITGTDSALIAGRKAQVLIWKREFSAPDRTRYTRTPGTITPSPIEPIALEQGTWIGTRATDGEALASGIYSAKWRKIGLRWMIEGEMYLTLA
jgi:ketosteroid isomerase-like protein